jgi:hypothetical protein
MVKVSIQQDRVHFDVEGWDKLWGFRSQLDIPLVHITAVRADPAAARGWFHGVKMPGTSIPGILTVGTFLQTDGAVFFDVHDPERTIVIDLDHEHFERLVVEVEDPAAVVSHLQSAIAPRTA